jgi:hypothetical protein
MNIKYTWKIELRDRQGNEEDAGIIALFGRREGKGVRRNRDRCAVRGEEARGGERGLSEYLANS